MSFDLADSLRRLEIKTSRQEGPDEGPKGIEYEDGDFMTMSARRKQNHTVRYCFPDFSLLPGGHELVLAQAAGAEFREHPTRNADGVGYDNSEIMTISPVWETSESRLPEEDDPDFAVKSASVTKLVDAMVDLLRAAGSTKVSFITGRYNYGPVQYRIKLTTVFESGKKRLLQFCLSQESWDLLGTDHPWVKIMNNIHMRASDIAWYHVQVQMSRQGHRDLALHDDAATPWEEKLDHTPLDFFLENVKVNTVGLSQGKKVDKKIVKARRGRARLLLPCDHSVIREEGINKIDDAFCLRYRCPRCHKSVLSEQDRIYLDLLKESTQHKTTREENKDWEELDHEPGWEPLRTITASAVYRSFDLARSYMSESTLSKPMLLHAKSFEETEFIAQALRDNLDTRNHIPARPKSLEQELIKFAETKMLEDVSEDGNVDINGNPMLPPGWNQFMEKLIRRTANFVFERECDETDEDHMDTHYHGDNTVSNQTFGIEEDSDEESSDEEEEEDVMMCSRPKMEREEDPKDDGVDTWMEDRLPRGAGFGGLKAKYALKE